MVNMAKRLLFVNIRYIVKNWAQWTIENNEIKTTNVKLFNNATMKLGSFVQDNDERTYGKLNLLSFTNDVNSGVLDAQSGHMDEHN